MVDLSAEQLDRYARHLILEGVGPEGQEAFLDASVLVVGAGGLGSPVLQYLSAAGVGSLTVADGDVVERSNLQRQVIHGTADVGRPKARSAREAIRELNPDITVSARETAVGPDEATSLAADHDVVVDCSDNFPTRFLLNDACQLTSTPLVHGAVYRFEGQALTVPATDSAPCYRCLFSEAPPPGTVPDCAETGVLGAVPGLIGTVQAIETLKLLLGAGEALAGRLLVVEALGMAVEEVPVRADPECPACGEDSTLRTVQQVTYEGDCAIQ
ncbi:MAG: ThiF family adenylyltransferase [Halodesulfurarchaeum sp.]